MAMLVVLCFLAFISSEAHGVQFIPQPTTSFVVEQGHGVILPFNYTLEPPENASVLIILLELNGSSIISYTEFRGSIIDTTTQGHIVGRPDVQIMSSPQTYVGLLIRQTMLSDTGTYIWSIQIDGTKTFDNRTELNVGKKPGTVLLVSSDERGMLHVYVYTLTCTVTGGIPSPNITILNGTEVIHTSPASTTTINVTVEFPSVFYCVGTNVLGSANESLALTGPTKAPGKPGNPNTALIVGVICGCVGGICIIVILVCVYKKKKPKTKPGKKELTLERRDVEGNDNTYALDENSTKLATEQEQEEKQQKNVKGRQHDQGPRGKTKPAGGDGRKKRVANADPNAEETEQEQEAKQQRSAKGPRGNTKPAGGDGRKKQVSNADPNAEETEQEQEAKQQLNVEGLQYADLDLRPTREPKPAGGDGRNKLVFNDDSHVEYAEVRKV